MKTVQGINMVEGLRPNRSKPRWPRCPPPTRVPTARTESVRCQISFVYSFARSYFVINLCTAQPCTSMPRLNQCHETLDPTEHVDELGRMPWVSQRSRRTSDPIGLTMGDDGRNGGSCTASSSQSSRCRIYTSNLCWGSQPTHTPCGTQN